MMVSYRNSKQTFENLDAISRTRALTDAESIQLEYAIKNMDKAERLTKVRGAYPCR